MGRVGELRHRASARFVERGDRLLYPVGLRGRGRASGAAFEAEIFHLTTVRDGLIVRIEGFSDRESLDAGARGHLD